MNYRTRRQRRQFVDKLHKAYELSYELDKLLVSLPQTNSICKATDCSGELHAYLLTALEMNDDAYEEFIEHIEKVHGDTLKDKRGTAWKS